jgi:hypothetical protein
MLIDRIVGAFTFRKGVYAEVEADTSFTNTAWLLVALAAFVNQIGAQAGLLAQGAAVRWLLASVGSTIINLVGFAAAVYVIVLVGKQVFNAEVDFGEMVRTLGLASVWRFIGGLGILNAFIPTALACLLSPLAFAVAILGLVAYFIAAKEALDLEDLQTAVTIIIGWLVMLVFSFFAGLVLGLLGLAASGAASIFS